MKRNTRIIGFALLLFFILGTAVVFAISENEAYTRGYRDGYSNARNYSQDWQKTIQKNMAWLNYFSSFSREDQLNSTNLRYQFDNGFEEGWADQKAGYRPAR